MRCGAAVSQGRCGDYSDKGKVVASALSSNAAGCKYLASTCGPVVVQVCYVDAKYLEKMWVDGNILCISADVVKKER
jgi:hypothetical protein